MDIKFQIADMVRTKYPDLINLIIGSESMDDDERRYWFSSIPEMTVENIDKLREILLTERNKLAVINAKYAEVLKTTANNKYLEYQDTQEQKRNNILHQEKVIAQQAQQNEEAALLQELNQL